jgi:anti-sigma factor RsiW
MHPNEIALTDFVDDALGPAERADVERHLERCAECRAIVEDQREIRGVAGTLDLRDPPIRAWGRIERAIKLEQEHGARASETSGLARLKPSRANYVAWLAAAAAIVLAAVVGLRLYPGTPSAPDGGPTAGTATAPDAASAQSVEAELRAAEEHYEKAINGLEQIAKSEQSALDPNTASTLQKNLAVIDQAIGESRAALRAQPASEPAQQSLMDNFKTKIALLQDTVALINEMRKGNDAGAARIVSGFKQKGN